MCNQVANDGSTVIRNGLRAAAGPVVGAAGLTVTGTFNIASGNLVESGAVSITSTGTSAPVLDSYAGTDAVFTASAPGGSVLSLLEGTNLLFDVRPQFG